VYEAVALAVAELMQEPMARRPEPATELTFAVFRPPVEHKIRLSQVAKWAEPSTKEGPAGIVKRQKVRALLGKEIAKL
jgi:hypothetical protein